MKKLIVNIDNLGNVGMCNILMGIEISIGIAKMTNRNHIEFRYSNSIFNSDKKLHIQDLFGIGYYGVSFVKTDEQPTEGVCICYGLEDLSNTVFCYNSTPSFRWLRKC